MPDENNNDQKPPVAQPPALRVDSPKPEEKAKQPDTPEERRKKHLDAVAAESDQARAERRAAEFKTHFDVHMLNVKEAHAAYPAPLDFRARGWDDFTDKEKRNWNERSKQIASTNRAYHLAVRRTFAAHQDEEAHLARLRRTKQEAA